MSLFVLISGFGDPHWDNKVRILENNLKIITTYPWVKLKVIICQYTLTKHLPEELLKKYPFLEVIYKEGIVGQFIKEFANPENLHEWDYIMLLLDDIELFNLNFEMILRYQKDLSLDIISPTLTEDSKYQYKYMLTAPELNIVIKITTVCEYFCMFFTLEKFKIYYSHISDNNPWMWGLDLIIDKHLHLSVGLLNKMCMKHWYKGESYILNIKHNPVIDFKNYISTYNETFETLANQKSVKYCIIDTNTINTP